ncbi:hypothetical protein ACQY0O_007943 [Thecaphora frezii]
MSAADVVSSGSQAALDATQELAALQAELAALHTALAGPLGPKLTNILNTTDTIPRSWVVVKNMTINPSLVFGPQLVTAIVFPALTGIVFALSIVYFFYFGGSSGDRWFIQAGVLFALTTHIFFSFALVYNFYDRMFGAMFHVDGWDMRSAGWQVPAAIITEVFPMLLGQMYFLARTSKFFTRGRKVFFGIGMMLLLFQVGFGLSSLQVWASTLDWYKILTTPRFNLANAVGLTGSSCMFMSNEIFISASLLYKLHKLRSRSKFAAGNSVMAKLGVLALQSNLALIVMAVFIIVAHQISPTGWFLPVLLAEHPVYSAFVLINLIYRRSMTAELAMGSSQVRMESVQGQGSHRPNPVTPLSTDTDIERYACTKSDQDADKSPVSSSDVEAHSISWRQ